jgi:hypothetical protein
LRLQERWGSGSSEYDYISCFYLMPPSPETDMVLFDGYCTLDLAQRNSQDGNWNNSISDSFSLKAPRQDHAAPCCDSQAEPKNPNGNGKASEALIIRQNNMLELTYPGEVGNANEGKAHRISAV